MIEIQVPNMNDSFSRVVLDNTQYQIRFTWNNFAERWSFGLYDMQKKPIFERIRIVPRSPLTIQVAMYPGVPSGNFVAFTDLPSVGRDDFINGKAKFTYTSMSEVT